MKAFHEHAQYIKDNWLPGNAIAFWQIKLEHEKAARLLLSEHCSPATFDVEFKTEKR